MTPQHFPAVWKALGLSGVLLSLCNQVLAQPCSITIDPDATICQGETVTLHGPPGFPNYSWSNGATSQDITVGSSGIYTCQVSYPTGNLVTNGNFSGGNSGFTTQFNYNSTLTTDGNYWIGTNATSYHPQWIGTGNGPFMMVNAGWQQPGWRFWCQTLPVCPGQTYTISFRAASVASVNPPTLAWFVNNVFTGDDLIPPVGQGQWQTLTTSWTAPAGVTSADFCVQVSSGHGIGNDFGFDDVNISATVVLTDAAQVTVTPLPVVDLGPNATLCTGQSLVLDAAVPGGTYLWQDGSTAPDYVVTGPGNYSVTVTASGCSASDAITVNYNAVPVVNLGPDQTLCTGQTLNLNVFQPGALYTWQNGSNSPSFTVTGAGTYSVTVWLNGCTSGDAIDVAYNPTPVADLGPDQTLCVGGQVTLTATTPGATYLWQDGSTGPTFDVSSAGTYDVDVTVNGCTDNDAVTVNYNPLPVAALGPDQTLCAGGTLDLNVAQPGATYLWQDGSIGPSFTVTTAGTYSVDVTLNGCSVSDAIDVSYNPLPVAVFGPDQTLCDGEILNLNVAQAGATYLWQDGSTGPSFAVTSAGTYSVDVTLNGCSVSDAITVSYNPLPVAAFGPDQTLCDGETLDLNVAQPGATYLWQDGSTGPSFTVTSAGTYSVDVTLNGCSISEAIDVSYNALPVAAFGPDQTLCDGEMLNLNVAQPGATYLWQDGSTGPLFTVTGPGTYSVDVMLSGCSVSDAIDVAYNPLPVADLGPHQTLCDGETLDLDVAQPGATYLWQDGSTNSSYTVSSAGTYSVDVLLNGCSASDAVNVSYNPLPAASLGPDATLCDGETLDLDVAQAGATYLWQDGSTGSSFTVGSAGTYSVDVLLNGCSTSDAIDVSYNPVPVADLGPDQTLCGGQTLDLDVMQPGATYLWQDGSTGPSFTVGSAGTYSVDVLLNGCAASDAVDVAYTPVLVVNLGVDQTLCDGDQLILNATTPGGTYLWQDGSIGPTFTVTSAGTYSVDVTASSCSASDAIMIGFNPIPAVDLGADQTVCPGTDVTLNATTTGATYLWQDGSTDATFTSDQPGIYSVQVTAGGCSTNDAVTIDHFNLQSVDLGPDVTICQGDAAVLGLSIPGATYDWSTGATSGSISASTADIYWVDATLNGCTVRDSLTVQVTSLPVVDLGADPSVCPGDLATLDATQTGAIYLWSTGASSPSINEGPGNYSVTVTVNGCSNSDAIVVNAFPAPQVDLGNDTTLCPGEQLVIDADQPGATYLWQDGSSNSSITANAAGNYSVELTDANGCVATDDIDVAYANASAIELGNDTTLCNGSQLVLDATLPGGTYLWSTGEDTPTINVGSAGNYSVTVTQGACSVADAVDVQFITAPVIDLGADVTLCPGEDLLLDATSIDATYLWTTGEQTATLDVTQDGTYSVTVTNAAGCETTDAITVTYATPSAVELGPDVELCAGQTVTLDAVLPGAAYEWSTGEQTVTIVVGTSAVYWVEVTQGNCSASDTVTVNVSPAPQIDLGLDLVLCPGDDVDLDATWPGATYLWSTGAATPGINVNTSDTYSVTVDLNGCTDTDDVIVTVLNPSAIDLGPDLSLCAGYQADLDATVAGATYLWSTGETTAIISASTNDTYWVEVTQGSCSVTDTVLVNVTDPGTIDLGPDLSSCEGESIVLDATLADATYLWDDGSTDAVRTVTTSGSYSVQAFVGQCTVAEAIDVTFNPLPVVDLGGDVDLCPQATTVFDATVTDATYLWQDGSTDATYTASTAGQVSVTVTLDGCEASDAASVAMLDGPQVALGNDTTLCEGSSLTMDVAQSGATYLWDDGSTSSNFTTSDAGTFSVEVSLNGCTATDAITVDVFSLTGVDLGADVTLCPGENATLNAGVNGTYTWSNGATSPSITVNQSGLYWVQVQVAACSARDSVQVTAVDLDAPDLGADITVCEGESVELNVVPGNASISWSTGSTADAITVTSAGVYTVTLELDGCTASDAVQVVMNEMVDEISLGGDRTICPGAPITLDATTAGANYVWSTGETTSAISVDQPGTYTVQLSGPCINATASVVIALGDCDPLVYVPNSFTPNGDGFNDLFFASVDGPMEEFTMDIFDRWGERIHTTELPATWDGTMNGEPVQDGVYVYKVRYHTRVNGRVVAKELIGHVTLLR